MHEISIADKDYCTLNCINCPKHEYEGSYITSLNEFSLQIEKAIKLGFTRIGLTPFYGDPYTIHNHFEKIDYLHTLDKITHISDATNLLEMANILEFVNFPKLEMTISFYGHNKTSYQNRTGKDKFEIFINNLKQLNIYCKEHEYTTKFIIQNRILNSVSSDEILECIPDLIFEIDNKGIIDKNYADAESYKHTGICNKLFKDNLVMSDGKLTYCCWHPNIEEFSGGNFLKDSKHLKLQKLVLDQSSGNYNKYCKNCSFFEPLSNDDIHPFLVGDLICKLI